MSDVEGFNEAVIGGLVMGGLRVKFDKGSGKNCGSSKCLPQAILTLTTFRVKLRIMHCSFLCQTWNSALQLSVPNFAFCRKGAE